MNNNNNLYNILNNFNKLSESDTPKPAAESKPKTLLESTMEQVMQEKYMGFKKTVGALKKQGGIENPEALAASIGRKKYGKAAFQKAAATGKKLGEEGDETNAPKYSMSNPGQFSDQEYKDALNRRYGQPDLDTSRMNQQTRDFYDKNPSFKQSGKEIVSPGDGRLASKVVPAVTDTKVDRIPMNTPGGGKQPSSIPKFLQKSGGGSLGSTHLGSPKAGMSPALDYPSVNEDDVEENRDAYQRDYDSSVSGMDTDREFQNRERNAGLEDEKNNYVVYIDGRQWKVFADRRQAENIARSLTAKGKKAEVYVTGEDVSEGEEGHTPRLSIGQQMARDGITYSPNRENELIDLMAQYMKKNGMSPKAIRYYLSYDEDYISDQLSDLPEEAQLNELSPELLKRARDKAGQKWAAADDRKDKKASAKHNAQDDKFHSAMRKKEKQGMEEESDWSNLGAEYRSTKPGTKEPTHTGEKEYFKGGVKHTKDYDREVSHTAATGEKRGRGRPKKSQFEGHYTIDRLIAEAFGEEDQEQSLTYEQDQLRNAIGDDLFAELQRSVRNGDYDFSDNLDYALYEYYFDDMPYGTRKARTGDPSEWIGDKIAEVFSDEMSEGSIKGGVWSADPPAPGQPNVPMPKGDPEGVPSNKKITPAKPATGTTTEPRKASPGWGKDDYTPLIPDTEKPGSARVSPAGSTVKPDSKGTMKPSSGDPEGVQEEDKNTEQKEDIIMTNELAEMMRLAGMSESKGSKPDYLDFDKDGDKKEPMKQALKDKKVDESEEKADKDYDGDGKIESGKDEYLGSKIAAAKKAGKLKEGEKVEEERCDECGMYESKCKCDESIQEALNQMRRIAGLKECDMSPVATGMGDMQQQQGKMNISTNMDSDGHKSVTITADGDSALELMQMLKLAGMGGHGSEEVDEQYLSEPIVAKPSPDDTTPAPTPAPPPAPPGSDGKEVEEDKDPRYHANTTPEEHVYPEQVLTRGGNGEVAGRNKQMHKDGYQFGDNPMAMKESMGLKFMKEYEGIKVKK